MPPKTLLPEPANEARLSALLKAPAYASRFEEVLGARAPQFVSSLIAIGNTMPDVEPKSIIGSAMVAAALDLPIDKNLGFSWIIPYRKGDRKYAQFQMGYKGYIQLGMRSGQYARMNAVAINQEVFKGWDEVGEPVLDWDSYDPDKEVWGYFFGFQLVNGFTKKAVWTKAKVIEHAKRYSQSYRNDSDIWRDQFHAMAIKTVTSNTLRKWGPLSVQLQRAVSSDQAIIKDIDAVPELPELEDQKPEKPVLEHPEKAKQEQARKEKEEAAAQEALKAEVAQAVKKQKEEEEKEEAEAGLAPQKPPEAPAPVPPPAPTPAPAAEPVAKTEPAAEALTEQQEALRKVIVDGGYSWDEFAAWGKATIFPKMNPPVNWSTVPDAQAQRWAVAYKGILAALKTCRDKHPKK